MSYIDKIIGFAIDLRDSMPKVSDSYVSGDGIMYKAIKDDLEVINNSIESYMILRDLLIDLDTNIKNCRDKYIHNKAAVAGIFEELGYAPTNTDVQTQQLPINTAAILPPVSVIDYVVDKHEPLFNVPIIDDLALPAIIVDDKNSVRGDGNLYYIKGTNKFGFRLNGHLFFGNIGEVYTYEKNPKKIKICARGKYCKNIGTCTYYHPDTRDTRNFISGGFAYQRKTATRTSDEIPGRKIGNKSTLKTDISRASHHDLQLYNDQCMHDILCNLIINNTT